jgi:hypothetical protein
MAVRRIGSIGRIFCSGHPVAASTEIPSCFWAAAIVIEVFLIAMLRPIASDSD